MPENLKEWKRREKGKKRANDEALLCTGRLYGLQRWHNNTIVTRDTTIKHSSWYSWSHCTRTFIFIMHICMEKTMTISSNIISTRIIFMMAIRKFYVCMDCVQLRINTSWKQDFEFYVYLGCTKLWTRCKQQQFLATTNTKQRYLMCFCCKCVNELKRYEPTI